MLGIHAASIAKLSHDHFTPLSGRTPTSANHTTSPGLPGKTGFLDAKRVTSNASYSADRDVGCACSPALLFQMDNDSRRADHTLASAQK